MPISLKSVLHRFRSILTFFFLKIENERHDKKLFTKTEIMFYMKQEYNLQESSVYY